MKKIIAMCFFVILSVAAQTKEIKKITTPNLDTITIGGGCYWCVEAIYENLIGVKSVISGFAGGKNINPSYEVVSYGNTGYAEVVQITFDKNVTSFKGVKTKCTITNI